MVTATLYLTVLPDARVDVCLYQHTAKGRPERTGQRIGILPWRQVLDAIAPAPDVRVRVRTEWPRVRKY